jgi:hypothetical protein
LAGAELRASSTAAFPLGSRGTLLAVGILSGFGEGFVLPLVVVTAYVATLTENLLALGLIPPLAFGVWNAGALITRWLMAPARARWPWAFGASLLRAAAMAGIAYVVWQSNLARTAQLETVLVLYGVFAFFSGCASASSNALVRTASDPGERSSVLTIRNTGAALAGLLAGSIVYQLFAEGGLSTERSFAFVFLTAAAVLAGAAFFTLMSRDIPGVMLPPPAAPGGTPAHARATRLFRRFLVFRVAFGVAAAADGFLIVYGLRELAMGFDQLGIAVISYAGMTAAGAAAWRILPSTIFARSSMQVAALLKVLPPLIAVSIPYVESSAYYQEHTDGQAVTHWMVVAAFAALGLAGSSIAAGSYAYLSAIAPVTSGSMVNLANGVLGIVSATAIGAGWIADRWGFDALFASALAASVVALLAGGLLPVTASGQARAGVARRSGASGAPRLLMR